jgi:hypothetical protein
MRSPPRRFHFVFGLREQTEAFHLLHYVCLASCIAVNRPDEIHFHYRHEPRGEWWERIAPALTLRPISGSPDGFVPARYEQTQEGRGIAQLGLQYAHESDFLRLDILAAEGGVYADMDTLFVHPYPDEWFAAECLIGEENAPFARGDVIRPTLCNAVMFAQPSSRFVRAWRTRMADVFDGTWNRHSCLEAARVWQRQPDSVRVLPAVYFYRYSASVQGLKNLLEESASLSDVYSLHLWAHLWWSEQRTDFSAVHAGQIDADWLRTRDCTLAHAARRFL